MEDEMRKKTFRTIAVVLALATILSCSAFATADTPILRSSNYLASYGAYCYAAGSGRVTVYFDVTGNGTQNYLGVSSLIIRQSADGGNTWTTAYNFLYPNYPNLMGTNCPFFSSSMVYYGTAGYKYYAILYFWGGSSLYVGDSRSYGTSVITAT